MGCSVCWVGDPDAGRSATCGGLARGRCFGQRVSTTGARRWGLTVDVTFGDLTCRLTPPIVVGTFPNTVLRLRLPPVTTVNDLVQFT
jgi:hypothetical protein